MDKSRRNLAKVLGVAGAGAAAWHKPVVDSVSLPAHATTTTCGCQNSVTGRANSFTYVSTGNGVGIAYHYIGHDCIGTLDDAHPAAEGETESEAIANWNAAYPQNCLNMELDGPYGIQGLERYTCQNVWYCGEGIE